VIAQLEHPVAHAAPAGQAQSVVRIAERLFPAYTLDQGRVHLAGCVLEDRLVVRVQGTRDSQPVERFVDAQGRDVNPALVQSLGISRTVSLEKAPPLAVRQLEQFLRQGLAQVEQRLAAEEGDFQLVSITAVWCKFAEGKLRFTFGETSADLPFAGWAETLNAPEFVCPASHERGFHLAATDDGRVTLAEQIATCEETGRRMLAANLTRCSVTGRQVLAELTSVCPVSGKPLLRRLLATCATCGQAVSPATLQLGHCAACRELHAVDKSDPRLARMLARYPELDRWRWWRMAETRAVQIFQGAGWWDRILVVADKNSLAIQRLATGKRLLPGWSFSQSPRLAEAVRP